MSYEDWSKEAEEDIEKIITKSLEKTKGMVIEGQYERLVEDRARYKIFQVTKRLVWVTWLLAIATIILTIINLFLK